MSVFNTNLIDMIGNVFTDLVIRTIIIISITDSLEFYRLNKNLNKLTPLFAFEVIVITIVPLVINIWWVLVHNNVV